MFPVSYPQQTVSLFALFIVLSVALCKSKLIFNLLADRRNNKANSDKTT